MEEHTVFVLESRHRWAPELQRQFSGQNVRVRGIRNAADVAGGSAGIGVVVADLESAATECLALFRAPPEVPVLVVSAAAQSSLEWSVRELGAVAYLTEPVSGDEVAATCRKIFGSCVSAALVSASATT